MSALTRLSLIAPLLICSCMNASDRVTPQYGPITIPEIDPDNSESGLYSAVREGNVLRVRQVLAAHPDLINEYERYTKWPLTPLQIAAERNQLAVMRVLIELGADLQRGGESSAPLQLAARAGHREAAEFLLANGAVLDIYSAVALDKRGEVQRILRLASMIGIASSVANTRIEFSWESEPLLHVATSRGHKEMAELLIHYGADPDAKVTKTLRPLISDINHRGVTVGLTPAGSFIGDLDVPIRKQK